MPRPGDRRFVTILFTDIVGSTDIAGELGDRRWRDLVRRHHAIVRSELKRFGGREMDTAGDGFFAIFESPGAAIRCACTISERVRDVGLEVRSGLHAGEVEQDGGKVGGIAVNTAARVMSLGGPGDVLVSSSLHDIVAGSTIGFVDQGMHELKGIEGEWRLFAVGSVDGVERADPVDPPEAAKVRFGIAPGPPGRRGTALVVGGLLAAAAVAGILVMVLTREETEPAKPPAAEPPPPNSIARLDVLTGELERVNERVSQNLAPQFDNDDLEVGEGSLWLLRGNTLNRIDPQDASTTRLAQESGFGIRGIDLGFGSVWSVALELSRLDPGTGEIEHTYRIGSQPLVDGPTDVVVAFDHVWVPTQDGRIMRVDPGSDAQTRFRVGGTPERLASGTDALWALDEFEGVVLRFDPTSGEVTDRIELSGGLDVIAAGEGYVWVLDSIGGTLTPIAEADREPLSPIDVGGEAEDVTVGRGSVWVAAGGSLLEINPATRQIVRRIEVASTPILEVAVDTASGSLWVSMAGGDLQTD
jgi:class 3 adenylate cyclase/streptogramin lyase